VPKPDVKIAISAMSGMIAKIRDNDNRFKSQEQFVLEFGRHWEPMPLPDEFEAMEPKQCFGNAFNLVLANRDLTYVEGYGISNSVPIPIQHAWAVDKSGNVVDPTWANPEERSYFGIPFKFDFVRDTVIEKETYGVIDDWARGWPLLTELWKEPEKWLELQEIENVSEST